MLFVFLHVSLHRNLTISIYSQISKYTKACLSLRVNLQHIPHYVFEKGAVHVGALQCYVCVCGFFHFTATLSLFLLFARMSLIFCSGWHSDKHDKFEREYGNVRSNRTRLCVDKHHFGACLLTDQRCDLESAQTDAPR